MATNNSIVPVYNIEDLSLDDMDKLIERGEVFNVQSKSSILSQCDTTSKEYSFWMSNSGRGVSVPPTSTQWENSRNG